MLVQIEKPIRKFHPFTQKLLDRCVSPFCGLVQQVGLMQRSRYEPAFFTAGAELCGVHRMLGLPQPKSGGYHIGGNGLFLDEMLIRTLAESIERYAQLLGEKNHFLPNCFKDYRSLKTEVLPVLDQTYLTLFSPEQFERANFPFEPFAADVPLSWTYLPSLAKSAGCWIPTQLLFVGYKVKKQQGERWINAAVSTGTAAHKTHTLAVRNALLELIQVDTAMGHWYGSSPCHQLILDDRVNDFVALLKKSTSSRLMPLFYWLPNPDLPGFVIATIFRRKSPPYYAIGLGIDTTLSSALYKSYLEAIGVNQLAKVSLFEMSQQRIATIDKEAIFDLDQNVTYYAGKSIDFKLEDRFHHQNPLKTTALPSDSHLDKSDELVFLVESFKKTHKALYYCDLTPIEAKSVGLVVSRVWSPDTLPLSLPSAVPQLHSRLSSYGGLTHAEPHPYP